MVGLDEFVKLPQAAQFSFVQEHGQYIHYRIKSWCMIHLYLVGARGPLEQSYYVEVWYLYDLKTIGLIRTFAGSEHLGPFLDNIQLALP